MPSEIDEFISRMNSVVCEARERTPKPEEWGFFAYGDGPAAAGGGCGGFLWFESRTSMLDFIRKYLVFWSGGPCASDPLSVAADVQRFLHGMHSNGVDAESSRERVNRVIQGYAQIVWWGQFWELLSADTDFGREVRSWFRGQGVSRLDGGPIAPEAASRFSSALQEYGI